LSGWVFVALTVIVLGYLVPHLVRSREVMVESRVTDRFSRQLRLVQPETAGPERSYRSDTRPLVHNPEISRRRTEALAMIRPTTPVAHRVNARELAAARAARAAEISRRAAAARRRMTLALTLAIITVAVIAGVAFGPVAWGWAVLPTAALGAVLFTGQKAAVIAARQDAKARAEMARLDQRLRLFRVQEAGSPAVVAPVRVPPAATHAVAGAGVESTAAVPASAVTSAAPTAFDGIIIGYQGKHVVTREIEDEPPRHARHAVGDFRATGAGTWTPVPVPLPTYTLKQENPRRDVEPYVDEATDDGGARVPMRPTTASPTFTVEDFEPVAQTFDLDSVLARRRAAGA